MPAGRNATRTRRGRAGPPQGCRPHASEEPRMATSEPMTWTERDKAVVWHGFTQMSTYASSDTAPVIVERAEGRELIDVDGRRYLDAISSLWVTTLGHHVP